MAGGGRCQRSYPPAPPAAPADGGEAPAHEHVFNDDILLNDGDLAYAAGQFPQIAHVLDNPELRDVFAKYQTEANVARDRVRRVGLATVVFATLALLTIPTRPIWVGLPHFRWVVLALDAAERRSSGIASLKRAIRENACT